jgi:hypothetical protein
MIKLKFLFLRYYWIPALVIFVAIIFNEFVLKGMDWKILGSLLTGILSYTYFVQKKRHEELSLFKELFKEFNSRYDELNEELNKIYSLEAGRELQVGEIQTLYNYFTLCGEEYLYYRKGYIFPEVWESWLNGMRYFYQKDRIGKLWQQELKQNSYYGFKVSMLERS